MFMRLLFWFILFYLLLKFIIRILIPVIMATKGVKSKMKDINENMGDFQSSGQTSANSEPFTKSQSKSTSPKGDYIDFEEIK